MNIQVQEYWPGEIRRDVISKISKDAGKDKSVTSFIAYQEIALKDLLPVSLEELQLRSEAAKSYFQVQNSLNLISTKDRLKKIKR